MRIRRPVSRVLCRPLRDAAAIPLDRPSRAGSRDLPGPLKPATALPGSILADWPGAGSLFGLAPGGACHATSVTSGPVRSYRTLSPLPRPRPRRSALCGAIPGVTPGGRYPPPCRRGARTFLELAPATARPSDPRRKLGNWRGESSKSLPIKGRTRAGAGRSDAPGSRRRRSHPPSPAASAAGRREPPSRCRRRTGPTAAGRTPGV